MVPASLTFGALPLASGGPLTAEIQRHNPFLTKKLDEGSLKAIFPEIFFFLTSAWRCGNRSKPLSRQLLSPTFLGNLYSSKPSPAAGC